MMNLNLFTDESNIADAPVNLIRIKAAGTPLTTEQYTFNKLVKRIESLQRLIKEDTLKLDQINKVYQEKISPCLTTLVNLKIQLCHLLDDKRKTVKLNQSQKYKLDNIICELLEDVMEMQDPSPETEYLYKKYLNESPGETQERFDEEEKEMFCDMLYQEFGLHIDPSMLTDNPDFGAIQEELENQMNAKKAKKQSKKKKTTKQKEKESFEQQKQDLKNKSLRSIYVALAKLLHPDAEPDENLKLEKEEMMKQVTIAYNNKDLMSLLKLEMQWINAFKNRLDKMDSDMLAVYLQLLRDQVKDLEKERDMLIFKPVYASIEPFLMRSMQAAVHEINFEAKRLKQSNNHFSSLIDQLKKGNKDRTVIQSIITDYYMGSEFEW